MQIFGMKGASVGDTTVLFCFWIFLSITLWGDRDGAISHWMCFISEVVLEFYKHLDCKCSFYELWGG